MGDLDTAKMSYRTIMFECSGEIVEKKSRFIATLAPVSTEDEAVEFINSMKKKYWDARHNCSAYIIAPADANGKDIEKCSDDGEPSRTAGMPMLDILKSEGLKNVVAVVTRYFGGILLGTGGLVRAYQGSLKEGIKAAEIGVMRQLMRCKVNTDYNGYGRITFFASQDGFIIENTVFTDVVTVMVLCDERSFGSMSKKMTEATSGKCVIEVLEQVYHCTKEE